MKKIHHGLFLGVFLIIFFIINTLLSQSFLNQINNNISIYDNVQVNYTNIRLVTVVGDTFFYNFAFIFTAISLVILFAIALFLEKTDNKSYFLTRSAIAIGILVVLAYNLNFMNYIDSFLNNHGTLSGSFLSLIVNGSNLDGSSGHFLDINLVALIVYGCIYIVYLIDENIRHKQLINKGGK